MISRITQNPRYAAVFLRAALGFSFLSAVADRFGLWGAFGQQHVAWGDFSHFVVYTGKLIWFAPAPVIPAIAWMATAAETALGVALLLGVFPRLMAALSGILLLTFAVTMTIALGIKAPLDASVFSASGGAFLLAFVVSIRSPGSAEDGDSNSPVRRSGS
jgi:uncharacterized membrane protein YphA (DoxX/SURF4 family)